MVFNTGENMHKAWYRKHFAVLKQVQEGKMKTLDKNLKMHHQKEWMGLVISNSTTFWFISKYVWLL